MYDGAPAHYTLNVRRILYVAFEQNWIGRGGSVPWPARSPDLNPIDFQVWGHFKYLVYSVPVHDVDTLRHQIIESCEVIRNQPGIFERVPFVNHYKNVYSNALNQMEAALSTCCNYFSSCLSLCLFS